MASWARGAHGAVLRGTQGDMCNMMSVAALLVLLLLLLVWWKKNQREQTGTGNDGREGRWNTGSNAEHGKRARKQQTTHPQLFYLKNGDTLHQPLLMRGNGHPL